MIVKENNRENPVKVYAIYWVKKNNILFRYFYVIPYKEYGGFLALREDECIILDNSMNNFVMTKGNYNDDVFLHQAAYQDNLIAKLIDHDPDAMKEFYRRLEELNSKI